MVGGMKLRGGTAALAVVAGLLASGTTATTAAAADLGGDCCADLEERVAELEATTARKGNRKVSLTVSGWVNQAVFFWDDGVENNAYVGTNGLEQDRFRLVGEAKIVDGWTAGYILEVGINGADSKQFSQTAQGGSNNNQLSDRKTAWFIKSKDYGKVTVGKFDPATYHLIDNIDTLLTRNVSDYEAAGVAIGAFRTRVNGGAPGVRWIDLFGGFNNGSPGQNGLRNGVRYDTPTIANFVASASWGEDDQWELALNYRGDIRDFKVNFGLGYGESTDPATNAAQCAQGTGDCQWWAIGGLVQHTPTGIYVYGGYGNNQIDLKAAQAGKDNESETWYIQAGVERKWFELGKTNVFGEYRSDDVGLTVAAESSNLNLWAAGIAQNIEKADLTLYALYRHYEGDFVALNSVAKTTVDDFDVVISGAKINF